MRLELQTDGDEFDKLIEFLKEACMLKSQRLDAIEETLVGLDTRVATLEATVGALPADVAAQLTAVRADVDGIKGVLSIVDEPEPGPTP